MLSKHYDKLSSHDSSCTTSRPTTAAVILHFTHLSKPTVVVLVIIARVQRMALQDQLRVAVLHQAAATPAIRGIRKPVKPGEFKWLRCCTFGGNISHWLLLRRIQGQQRRSCVCAVPGISREANSSHQAYYTRDDARSVRGGRLVLWRSQGDHTRSHRETWCKRPMG
jgi:hypothetical protein